MHIANKLINNKGRLVFDKQTMSYIFLIKGEEVIRDRLDLSKPSIGQKVLSALRICGSEEKKTVIEAH